jgi:hypothetical protein
MVEGRYKYKVQGMSDFPWDMLRHDRVWPLSTPEPHRMDSNEVWRKVRTVEVAGHGCTPDRWLSFGWSVVDAATVINRGGQG